MNKIITILITMGLSSSLAVGQNQESTKVWNFGADVNLFFIPDDFFVLPIFRADRNVLHLQARYNNEDMETFSAWIGYNFTGGKNFEYTITPMLGGVVGRTKGIAIGAEITLSYEGFGLHSLGEYLFDAESTENNFYYNWSDFTYSPKDWLWFGISAQRTRLYQTDLDIQRGLLIGGGLKQWELTTYLYNIGFDDPFFIMTISTYF